MSDFKQLLQTVCKPSNKPYSPRHARRKAVAVGILARWIFEYAKKTKESGAPKLKAMFQSIYRIVRK